VRELLSIELQNKGLATPIYAIAKKVYEENGLVWRKNRRLLEGIGEALNEDYPGGDKIVELYKQDFSPDENIFVEDCRRQTQADFFKEQGSIFVRVTAVEAVRKSRCKPGEWAEGHVSDTELDDFPADFTITNNGKSLDDLKQDVYNKVVVHLVTNYGKRNETDSIREA